ncbi:MAG: cupin domain-containing protein [Methanomicrobiaceae archaeon]|nr:cupin domain-containing protein [Methanomicrobiaceae archaeon]
MADHVTLGFFTAAAVVAVVLLAAHLLVRTDGGLSEHTAPYDAVVTILDGEVEVWVAGQAHRMTEGDTIIFPAPDSSPDRIQSEESAGDVPLHIPEQREHCEVFCLR